ncbi:MAG: Gp49 family protein [Cetobacterium sp.]|uniref:Gp49 family protein n=1 Tax=Cetobacterium sp. TaxID=2071632 RepID=UPI003F3C6E76
MKLQTIQVALINYEKDGVADVLGSKEYPIENNKIPKELVQSFVTKKEVTTERVFGKLTTILKYELQNGFTGVESTSCVDEKNYSEEIGEKILLKKLEDKIWFGLGFALGMAK